MGPPGDQAGDRLGSDGMRGLTQCSRGPARATDLATTCYKMAPSLMPLDRDTGHSPRARVLASLSTCLMNLCVISLTVPMYAWEKYRTGGINLGGTISMFIDQ